MVDSLHSGAVGADLHVPGYVQNSDPLAVGAGKMWIDTTLGVGKWIVKLRNAANTGWETVINSGSVDGVAIGATTPAAGTFTTLQANTSFKVNAAGIAADFGTGAGVASFRISGGAGSVRDTIYRTGTAARWEVGVNSAAEGGSNAGSDFDFISFADAGTVLTNPVLRLTRSTGKATFSNDVQVGGAFQHNGTTFGMFGTTATTRGAQAAATGTPQATTFVTSSVTLPQLAGVVMNMITILRSYGAFS